MLGVPLQTFRGNTIVKLVAVVLTLMALSNLSGLTLTGEALAVSIVSGLIFALFLFWLYWLWSIEVVIYDGGISSKTCLGTQEMRWDDVQRFTYSATRQSVNFIPVGTYYNLRLEDSQGKRIKFGNRVSEMEKLSNELIARTLPPLVKRAADQFNSGAEVDFGAIKLSREKGFRAKTFFRTVEVPLDQVIDYRIEEGQFHVFQQGRGLAAISAPMSEVPNAFALHAILDSMFSREQEPAAG